MYRQRFAGRIVWLDPAGDPTACAKMAESIDSERLCGSSVHWPLQDAIGGKMEAEDFYF